MHKAPNISADTDSIQIYSLADIQNIIEKSDIRPLGQGTDLQIWDKQTQHTGNLKNRQDASYVDWSDVFG